MIKSPLALLICCAIVPTGTRAATYNAIYSAANSQAVPEVALFSPSGTLYGTTVTWYYAAKTAPSGTIFALTPPAAGSTSWTYSTLYSFPSKCKCSPVVSAMDSSGNLYGVTNSNKGGKGTASTFKFDPTTGTLTTLYSSAIGNLSLGSDGLLYGIGAGGTAGNGTFLQLDPTSGGAPTVLYNLTSSESGPSGLTTDGSGKSIRHIRFHQ